MASKRVGAEAKIQAEWRKKIDNAIIDNASQISEVCANFVICVLREKECMQEDISIIQEKAVEISNAFDCIKEVWQKYQ